MMEGWQGYGDGPDRRAVGLTRRRLLALGGLGAAAVVTGCEGSTTPGTSGASGSRGGVLTIAQGTVSNVAAPVSQAVHTQSWRRAVYDTLIDFDPQTRDFVPRVATEWALSSDKLRLDLTLRDGVEWHSGRPLESDDVKYAIEQQLKDKPPFPLGAALQQVKGIETGDGKVSLVFKQPVSAILDALSMLALIDRESHAEFLKGTRHVGTGPFQWDKFVQGVSLSLTRNAKYWERDKPLLDRIEIRFIERPEALVAAVRSGQVAVGLNLLPLDRSTLEQAGTWSVTSYNTYGACIYLGANVKVAPLDRKEVRHAIHLAIDRERINKDMYLGQAKVSPAPWGPTSVANDPGVNERYARDLEKAKGLLRGIQLPDAPLVINSLVTYSRVAEIVAYNLGELGLKTRSETLTPPANQDRFVNRSYSGLYVGVHGFNAISPVDVVTGSAPYKPKKNLFNFESPEYETLVTQIATAADDAALKSASAALTDFLLDQAFCLDLVQTTNNVAAGKGVGGWKYNGWDELLLADAWTSGR